MQVLFVIHHYRLYHTNERSDGQREGKKYNARITLHQSFNFTISCPSYCTILRSAAVRYAAFLHPPPNPFTQLTTSQLLPSYPHFVHPSIHLENKEKKAEEGFSISWASRNGRGKKTLSHCQSFWFFASKVIQFHSGRDPNRTHSNAVAMQSPGKKGGWDQKR